MFILPLRHFKPSCIVVLGLTLLTFAPRPLQGEELPHSGLIAQKSKAKQPSKGDKTPSKGDKTPKGPSKPASESAKPKGTGSSSSARAPSAQPIVQQTPLDVSLAIQRITLDNGLRVVMNVVPNSTVAVGITYDVGARDEQSGASGWAFLFERMMFRGSKNVVDGQHAHLVASHGGLMDTATSADSTDLFQVVPSNHLELVLWLEADRMKSLQLKADTFDRERQWLLAEHQQTRFTLYDPSTQRLGALVFQGYWPYEHGTVGTVADLQQFNVQSAMDFYRAHYGPNHAILTIVGDFVVDDTIAMVHKYFDDIPKGAEASFADVPFPEQTSQRTAVMKAHDIATPAILYGWPAPPRNHPDFYPVQLVAMILGAGNSSRLTQLLVHTKGVVDTVHVHLQGHRGPSLFQIDTQLAQGAKVADVEKFIEAEIKDLSSRGITRDDFLKVQRQAQTAFVVELEKSLQRARSLAYFELCFRDATHLNKEVERLLAVTQDDLQRVVRHYLGPIRRTIVETYPIDSEQTSAAGQPKPPSTHPSSAAAPGNKQAQQGPKKAASHKKQPTPKKPLKKKK